MYSFSFYFGWLPTACFSQRWGVSALNNYEARDLLELLEHYVICLAANVIQCATYTHTHKHTCRHSYTLRFTFSGCTENWMQLSLVECCCWHVRVCLCVCIRLCFGWDSGKRRMIRNHVIYRSASIFSLHIITIISLLLSFVSVHVHEILYTITDNMHGTRSLLSLIFM